MARRGELSPYGSMISNQKDHMSEQVECVSGKKIESIETRNSIFNRIVTPQQSIYHYYTLPYDF
jgi:hypothetical protein